MRQEKGFLLPELLMSVAVFSLMMLLTTMVLRGGEEQARLSDTKMKLQESVREAIQRIGLEVRESSSSRVAVSQGGTILTIQIPAGVSNAGVITWSGPITYQVGGNRTQLVRVDGGTGQTTVLANDIQGVNFGFTSSPITSINFSVTARRTLANGRILTVTSPVEEVRLRNP